MMQLIFSTALYNKIFLRCNVGIVIALNIFMNYSGYYKTVLFCLISAANLFAQIEIDQVAASDKATVYMLRTNGKGPNNKIPLFIDENYVGYLDRGKYLRFELEPGEHMIWTKGKHYGFYKDNFEVGEIYVIQAKVHQGPFDNGSYALKSMTQEDEKILKKLAKRIEENKEQIISEKEFLKQQKKRAHLIEDKDEHYAIWLEEGNNDGFKLNPIHLFHLLK